MTKRKGETSRVKVEEVLSRCPDVDLKTGGEGDVSNAARLERVCFMFDLVSLCQGVSRIAELN